MLSNQSLCYLFWLVLSKAILASLNQWLRVVKERHREETRRENQRYVCSTALKAISEASFPCAARATLYKCLQPIGEGCVNQEKGFFDLHLQGRRNTEQLSIYHSDLISMTPNHSFGKHEKLSSFLLPSMMSSKTLGSCGLNDNYN